MLKEPIKFYPILKEKIWGGEKLMQRLQKKSDKKNIGESWEITSVEEDISIVSTGIEIGKNLTELIKKYKGSLVGEAIYSVFGDKFPLLIKFIDAKEALSIQLHPNDALAKKRHNSFGKTEMWYVMQADKNANLIVGFKKKVTSNLYKEHLENKSLLEILNRDIVTEGDVYFIPTGRVHAIGAGVLLAEIQQTSDITYRIYDWERQDDKGNYRDLHTEEALDALDYKVLESYKTTYKKTINKSETIVSCPYFKTNMLQINGEVTINHSKKDSFVIYMNVYGNVEFKYNKTQKMSLDIGETLLIPNSLNKFTITSKDNAKLLEVYIE